MDQITRRDKLMRLRSLPLCAYCPPHVQRQRADAGYFAGRPICQVCEGKFEGLAADPYDFDMEGD